MFPVREACHSPRTCLLCFAVLLAGCGKAAPLPPCYVDIPLYDARGNRLSYKVMSVTPEGGKNVDLLKFADPKYRVTAKGERLYFSKKFVGARRIEVTLKSETSSTVVARIAVMGCQQRTSLSDGRLDTELDVSTSTVQGHFTGCAMAGDWWVNATPMFNGQEYPLIHEGFIQSDGAFWITSSMQGQRHMIVVGKGKEPVKVFAADVVIGGKNELGDIDLSASCPK